MFRVLEFRNNLHACNFFSLRVKKSLGPVDSLAAAVIGDNVRRSSASSECSSEASSVFAGGRRMEALLQALCSERKAGGVFEKYIDRQRNRVSGNKMHLCAFNKNAFMLFLNNYGRKGEGVFYKVQGVKG